MLAQLNFLNGGFVLGVGLHHSVLDGTACVEVMRAWATFCGGEKGEIRVAPVLTDRGRLLHKPERAVTLDGFPEFQEVHEEEKKKLMKIIQPPNNPLHLHSPTHQAIYYFPSSTLSALKAQLSPTPPSWISTNDALTALLFSCVITARAPHPVDPSSCVQLAINLDARAYFSAFLPPGYLGNAVLHSQISALYAELRPSVSNLSSLALRVRRRLQEVGSVEYAEGFLAALHGVEDISAVVAGFLGPGMFVAPWQVQGFYGIDWGTLGSGGRVGIERMRAANEVVREGICQIYPRVEGDGEGDDGGLEVLVGLPAEATARLREMELWRKWARWRCD